MKKIFLLLVAALFLFSSCKQETKSQGPTQMEQVMAIHDEVMPKTSKIGKLVSQLKPLADSLGTDSEEAKTMKDLQDAHKSMMDWMQNFGNRFELKEIMEGQELSDEKKQWLNEEEENINVVKEKINSSIAKAEALLKKTN